jgi:hypothetical protein
VAGFIRQAACNNVAYGRGFTLAGAAARAPRCQSSLLSLPKGSEERTREDMQAQFGNREPEMAHTVLTNTRARPIDCHGLPAALSRLTCAARSWICLRKFVCLSTTPLCSNTPVLELASNPIIPIWLSLASAAPSAQRPWNYSIRIYPCAPNTRSRASCTTRAKLAARL